MKILNLYIGIGENIKLRLNSKLRYSLYTLLLVAFLTSCDSMKAESEYNKRSWEIKKMNMELDYLERLYKFKSDIEFEQKIAKIDSLIKNYK